MNITMKKYNSNYHRLTVYLNNWEHKDKFQTTYTYKNDLKSTPITSVQDAVAVVHTLHSLPSDTAADISKKIRKVVFNGVEIPIGASIGQHTKNGWIVK